MSVAKVLCVGVNPAFDITLVLDGLDADRVNRVEREHRQAAGKAANVACVLAGKGVPVALTGFYGGDTWSEWRSLFGARSAGVELLPVITSGSTRQNITLLADGKTVKVNRAGDAVDESAVQSLTVQLVSWLKPDDIAVFTGSIPPGMSRRQYLELAGAAADAGARVALDTDALSEEELLSIRPWLYKPNAHELAKLCGVDAADDHALIEQACRLAQSGVDTVLLTLGGRGLAVVTGTEAVRVEAGKVEAVNTVGAGDAALAAYIAAFLREEPLTGCAEAAARAGKQAVTAAY